jgi:hypothetical protein
MINIKESLSFIEKNGSDMEIARIRYILYNEKPPSKIIQSFIKLQTSEGCFPFALVKGNPDSLNATVKALLRMDELGLLDSPTARKTFK